MTLAAWVQAFATVALVVITITYAVLTNRVAKSAQRTSAAAERALLLDVAPIVFPRRTVQGPDVTGSLHNLGGRAALEIDMKVFLDQVEVWRNSVTLIKENDKKTWEFAYDPKQTGIRATALFTIECTYMSLTGDLFRTVKRYRSGEQHEFEVLFKGPTGWQRLSLTENLDLESGL